MSEICVHSEEDEINIVQIIHKVKAIPEQAVEVHRFVRRRSSYIFYTIGSQMAVRMSAFLAGLNLAPGRFLVLISVRG
jgi:hypothetical protein